MRLIDADGLKNVIYESWGGDPYYHTSKGYPEKTETEIRAEAASLFLENIDAQPTIEAEPRWVPVTEREPDGGAHVLVTLRWAADDYEVTEIDWFFDVANGGLFADKVIAWMPLPEPYREVEE